MQCPWNKLTKSESGAVPGAAGQTAARRQNRRWFLRIVRGLYCGVCQRARFSGSWEGIAPLAGFLCGNSGMRQERGYSRRILAAGGGPTRGST